jgi:glycosyltransferase involved in cell wall biosynthesis
MQTECSAERSMFGWDEGRSVVAEFDGGALTSDAGGCCSAPPTNVWVWFAGLREHSAGYIAMNSQSLPTPTQRRIKLHFFFRKPRPAASYSIERLFSTIIASLPPNRFEVQCLICPFYSNGLLRRLLLLFWASLHQGDINHITGDVDYLGLFMRRSRTVLTIHDLASLNRLKGWRRYLYWLFWVQLPIIRASHVTTISETIYSEIRAALCTDPKTLDVIPNCVTVSIAPRLKNICPKQFRVLHIGTGRNKNLDRVITAVAELPCVLVIIGRLSAAQENLLRKHQLKYENYSAVTDEEILACYYGVDIVLFVSLYEGFGLPILEAQAVGRPVVTSNREPMRSIAGQGALFVDPEDVDAIREGVRMVVSNVELQSRLLAFGLENVKRYEPGKIALEYASLYERIIAKESSVF